MEHLLFGTVLYSGMILLKSPLQVISITNLVLWQKCKIQLTQNSIFAVLCIFIFSTRVPFFCPTEWTCEESRTVFKSDLIFFFVGHKSKACFFTQDSKTSMRLFELLKDSKNVIINFICQVCAKEKFDSSRLCLSRFN